jgi:TonB family protein
MRTDLILPLLLLLGMQQPPDMNDLRALMAARRFEEAAEGARGYLAANPDGNDVVVARAILCSARLEGNLPPPVSNEPLKVEGEVRRPEKIYGTSPQYTNNAREEKVNGVVIYETTIDHEGCVRDVRLVQGLHPELDASAKWSIERWVFRPAMLKGQPVAVNYTLTVNFQIQ